MSALLRSSESIAAPLEDTDATTFARFIVKKPSGKSPEVNEKLDAAFSQTYFVLVQWLPSSSGLGATPSGSARSLRSTPGGSASVGSASLSFDALAPHHPTASTSRILIDMTGPHHQHASSSASAAAAMMNMNVASAASFAVSATFDNYASTAASPAARPKHEPSNMATAASAAFDPATVVAASFAVTDGRHVWRALAKTHDLLEEYNSMVLAATTTTAAAAAADRPSPSLSSSPSSSLSSASLFAAPGSDTPPPARKSRAGARATAVKRETQSADAGLFTLAEYVATSNHMLAVQDNERYAYELTRTTGRSALGHIDGSLNPPLTISSSISSTPASMSESLVSSSFAHSDPSSTSSASLFPSSALPATGEADALVLQWLRRFNGFTILQGKVTLPLSRESPEAIVTSFFGDLIDDRRILVAAARNLRRECALWSTQRDSAVNQFAEAVHSARTTETALYTKFAAVLNSKKAEIRSLARHAEETAARAQQLEEENANLQARLQELDEKLRLGAGSKRSSAGNGASKGSASNTTSTAASSKSGLAGGAHFTRRSSSNASSNASSTSSSSASVRKDDADGAVALSLARTDSSASPRTTRTATIQKSKTPELEAATSTASDPGQGAQRKSARRPQSILDDVMDLVFDSIGAGETVVKKENQSDVRASEPRSKVPPSSPRSSSATRQRRRDSSGASPPQGVSVGDLATPEPRRVSKRLSGVKNEKDDWMDLGDLSVFGRSETPVQSTRQPAARRLKRTHAEAEKSNGTVALSASKHSGGSEASGSAGASTDKRLRHTGPSKQDSMDLDDMLMRLR